jgi:hypothetical protein
MSLPSPRTPALANRRRNDTVVSLGLLAAAAWAAVVVSARSSATTTWSHTLSSYGCSWTIREEGST